MNRRSETFANFLFPNNVDSLEVAILTPAGKSYEYKASDSSFETDVESLQSKKKSSSEK